jgi:hypothetical protein
MREVAHTQSSIIRLIKCPLHSLVAIDEKRQAHFLSRENDFSPLPVAARNAVMCEPLVFLVRSPHEGVLTLIRLAGQYKPSLPAFFAKTPIMKNGPMWSGRVLADRKPKRTEVLEQFGLPLLLSLRQRASNPNWTLEQLRVLHEILKSADTDNHWALRVSLFLNDFDRAQTVLRMTDPSSPNFLTNRLKLALFGLNRLTSAVEIAATDLTEGNLLDDAVDVLMITGNWELALTKQIEGRDLVGAMLNASARPAVDERRLVLKELAEEAASDGQFACAMHVLAECGGVGEIAAAFEKAGEVEQSRVVPALLPSQL